jgi:hypothetical protein
VLAKQLECPLLTFDRELLQLLSDVVVQPGPWGSTNRLITTELDD